MKEEEEEVERERMSEKTAAGVEDRAERDTKTEKNGETPRGHGE